MGWTVAYFTFGSYALPIWPWIVVMEIILVLGALLIALFSGGLEEGILVAVFLLLAQKLKGNVLVLRVMGSSMGLRPLLVFFAIWRGMLLFERRQ